MLNNIGKIFQYIVLGFVVYGVYLWIYEFMNYDYNTGFAIKEVYATIGEKYQIGGQEGKYTKICDLQIERGCFSGYLKGVKIINTNEAYIYFQLSQSNITTITLSTATGKTAEIQYKYHFFGISEGNNIKVASKDDFPVYGHIQGKDIHLYSEKEIELLDRVKMEIFKELKKNPTIIIDAKSYKHYDIIPENEDWNIKK